MLTSIYPQEARVSIQKIKTCRVIFFFLSLVYIIILNAYYLIIFFRPDIGTDILNPLIFITRLSKVPMDFYIEILFISLLVFFLKYRKDQSVKHTFSLYNWIVLIIILMLYTLCVFQSILMIAWTFD